MVVNITFFLDQLSSRFFSKMAISAAHPLPDLISRRWNDVKDQTLNIRSAVVVDFNYLSTFPYVQVTIFREGPFGDFGTRKVLLTLSTSPLSAATTSPTSPSTETSSLSSLDRPESDWWSRFREWKAMHQNFGNNSAHRSFRFRKPTSLGNTEWL